MSWACLCQVLAVVVIFFGLAYSHNNIGYGYCPEAKQFNRTKRVVGGKPAKPHAFPWLVSIQKKTSSGDSGTWTHICSGSIVQNDSVITAASCFRIGQGGTDQMQDPKYIHDNIVVVAGVHKLDDTQEHYRQYRDVHAIRTNSKYTGNGTANDMALVELKRPLVFNKRVLPICITRHEGQVGLKCQVAGWGDTRRVRKGSTGSLNSATVPLLDPTDCRSIKDYEFCAGYAGGLLDACRGDTGAPLVCPVEGHWVQFGIASRPGCAEKSQATIYTDLSVKASSKLAFLSNIDSKPPNITSDQLKFEYGEGAVTVPTKNPTTTSMLSLSKRPTPTPTSIKKKTTVKVIPTKTPTTTKKGKTTVKATPTKRPTTAKKGKTTVKGIPTKTPTTAKKGKTTVEATPTKTPTPRTKGKTTPTSIPSKTSIAPRKRTQKSDSVRRLPPHKRKKTHKKKTTLTSIPTKTPTPLPPKASKQT